MNRNFSHSKWPEIREKLKLKWDKFEDNDLDDLKGHLDLLSEKIQTRYAVDKEFADSEMYTFKGQLNPKNNNIISHQNH
jgi:uncharacterized protein YjbJ (UPF0337 family)